MPARQPFTVLCQTLRPNRVNGWSDLHTHTTHSDGLYMPAQVVELAARSGLVGVAITDHDSLAGIAEARAVAPPKLEVIAGVEITAEHNGRELHLLGFFFRPEDEALGLSLERLRVHRVERFWAMAGRLRACGVSVTDEELRAAAGSESLGRRHLAELLVQGKQAGSVREVFARYLHDGGRAVVPKVRLPAEEAIALVRGAGGVSSWAHPGADCTRESVMQLRRLGLQALEAEFPSGRKLRCQQLRAWAAEFGLAVTGGSDCHGPGHYRRAVGACGVTIQELNLLRQMAAE